MGFSNALQDGTSFSPLRALGSKAVVSWPEHIQALRVESFDSVIWGVKWSSDQFLFIYIYIFLHLINQVSTESQPFH